MEDKVEIRRLVRQRIKEMTAERRDAAAERIFEQIEQHEAFAQAECIALFASMNDEVATSRPLARWPKMGKRVVVPRVEGETMSFYDYHTDKMKAGAYGIMEPEGDTPTAPESIDLIIVPARAFTREGIRLGRGGGFYDKYMSLEGFHAHKIGIAYECQIFDSLPCHKHDIMVDCVVTELDC